MTVTDILAGYDERIARIAAELRSFLLKELKGITETADNTASLIGYGFGTGYKDMICVIMLSKKGVKLGFYQGSQLPDPEKLLTGTGKIHRYLPVGSAADIKNPALKNFIREALIAHEKRKK